MFPYVSTKQFGEAKYNYKDPYGPNFLDLNRHSFIKFTIKREKKGCVFEVGLQHIPVTRLN